MSLNTNMDRKKLGGIINGGLLWVLGPWEFFIQHNPAIFHGQFDRLRQ